MAVIKNEDIEKNESEINLLENYDIETFYKEEVSYGNRRVIFLKINFQRYFRKSLGSRI